MNEHKIDLDKISKFMLAGKAIFTIRNEGTKNQFTYRITKLDEDKSDSGLSIWFVSVLTQPDNKRGYSFIGSLRQSGVYKHSAKSTIGEEAQSVVTFKWFLVHLTKRTLPSFISVFHEGSCGRCGRSLTVPESIKSGYGPECVGKL